MNNMFDCSQFRSLIIEPVLSKLQVYSKEAEELLVFTCAAESNGGQYLHQVKGPALGVYQMEPATYTDLWVNYIRARNRLATLMALHFQCNKIPEVDRMVYDLHYATAMARIHYLRFKTKLPETTDLEGLWNYYKKNYNTDKGKAKKEEAIKKYQDFIKS
jgi:hypothetical protein